MGVLTRDQIVAVTPRIHREMVEAWGGEVCLRSMSGVDRRQLVENITKNGESDPSIFVDALQFTLCDEDGALLFRDNGGRGILEQKDCTILETLGQRALTISGMGPDAVASAEGNSGEITIDGSTTP
jgi:hypothetical protein